MIKLYVTYIISTFHVEEGVLILAGAFKEQFLFETTIVYFEILLAPQRDAVVTIILVKFQRNLKACIEITRYLLRKYIH